jgi:hypothetical protein
VKDDQTFPFHLQEELDSRNVAYRVLNAGVPGYNLRQSLDRWAIDVRPHYDCKIIIINAAHDAFLISYYKQYWTPESTWASIQFGIWGARRSSIFYFSDRAISRLWSTKSAKLEDQITTLRQDFLAQLSRPASTKISIVLMPINLCFYSNAPLDDPRNARACEQFREVVQGVQPAVVAVNMMLKQIAASNHLLFVDTNALFDKLGREGKFIDFIHLSNDGAHDVAKYLADQMMQSHTIARQ